jgi:hypothetical protein
VVTRNLSELKKGAEVTNEGGGVDESEEEEEEDDGEDNFDEAGNETVNKEFVRKSMPVTFLS